MKTRVFVFSLTLPLLLLARPASAEDNPHVRYQNELLARSLSSADKALCDGKLGARSPDNASAYDQCHVTRLFVFDLKAKQAKGFPPMTEIKYCTKAEIPLVMDALPPG